MGQLIGVVARGGPAFVDALQRAWDAGDAVLPIDTRWPGPLRRRLIAGLAPAALVDPVDQERTAVDLEARPGPTLEGDALVVATSGSTGEPKGVVLTHDALAAHARAVHRRLAVTDDDRWLACLPLAHVGGLGVVVRALVEGVGLEVHDGFDAEAVAVAASRDGGATLTSLVPTALDRVGAEGFRWVVLGGSADTAMTRPANVVRTWGLTETGGGVVYDGRPLPGVEVASVGGQLWVRSPTLTRGLRQPDGAIRDLRRHRPDESSSLGWLATGDGGEVAPDGTVTVRGRLVDMIVTGGENLWPEPVEAVLRTHPAVAEVAVAGRPDPEWGQRVEAWVVVAEGSEAPSLVELRDHVRAQLPAWCAPRARHLAPALPRTTGGKVVRSRLTG